VVRPIIEGDEVTPITFEEAQEVVDYAKAKNVEVVDVAKGEAVRENVERVLRENPGVLVLHANHGNEGAWFGADERACVDLNNVELLAYRECYANNCSSAAKLGVEAWKLGAVYYGFREVFVFTIEEEPYFKQFVNHGIKKRIDGLSWKECLSSAKQLAQKLVDELVKAGKGLAAACLHHDAEVLVCYTEDTPPTSDCPLRKIALKVFGPKIGWKLSRKYGLSILLFGGGLGVYTHDRVAEWVVLGCRLHGIDVGLILIVASWVIIWLPLERLKVHD
jgi:hypothetical protein